MTEKELLARIQDGDETAFLEIYQRWQGILYRFGWQMTGSAALAEDLTQDVFLLILRGKLSFNPSKGSFSSFIYGVARNLALKALRKNRKLFDMSTLFEKDRMQRELPNPFLELAKDESASQVRRCILSLPEQYREVIVLCDLHEKSYAEVAEITSTAIGTVRSRLHRGRELLLQKMQHDKKTVPEQKGGSRYEIPAL